MAVCAEDFDNGDLGDSSFAFLLFKPDQLGVTVSLNKCYNLVIGHFETGIVVVSELKLVVSTGFDRLIDSVEDEDVTRHLSIHKASKNDDFRFVQRSTKTSLSWLKLIFSRNLSPILRELLSGVCGYFEAFNCDNQALRISSAEDVYLVFQETTAVGHPAFIQERHGFPLVLLNVVSDAGCHVIVPIGTTNKDKELVTDFTEAR